MTVATASRAVLVEVDRCVACKNCEWACAKAHAGYESGEEALLSEDQLVPRVHIISADDHNVPIQCRHCADAPCVAACPTEALYKADDGRVLTDAENCIACKACVRVCPYEAIFWDESREVIAKCDVCEGLIEEGQDTYCVQACPTNALHTVTVEELHEADASRQYDSIVRDESRMQNAGPGVSFDIDPEVCICCGRCARECPVDCISGETGKAPAKATAEDREKGKVGEPFEIDSETCVNCGTCLEVCPVSAVRKR